MQKENGLSDTTDRPDQEGAIALAIWSVCSDGNSDPYRVATDVIRSLYRHGYCIVEKDAETHG